ncbi:MAG: hypothetical protein HYX48_00905 [Chlamydiales bacterium]|nr:hypothetical protein [Chlamydiales bacterium]
MEIKKRKGPALKAKKKPKEAEISDKEFNSLAKKVIENNKKALKRLANK